MQTFSILQQKYVYKEIKPGTFPKFAWFIKFLPTSFLFLLSIRSHKPFLLRLQLCVLFANFPQLLSVLVTFGRSTLVRFMAVTATDLHIDIQKQLQARLLFTTACSNGPNRELSLANRS